MPGKRDVLGHHTKSVWGNDEAEIGQGAARGRYLPLAGVGAEPKAKEESIDLAARSTKCSSIIGEDEEIVAGKDIVERALRVGVIDDAGGESVGPAAGDSAQAAS